MPDSPTVEKKIVDLSDLAYDLIGVENSLAAVQLAIQKIGHRFGADRAILYLFDEHPKQAHTICQWHKETGESSVIDEDLDLTKMTWLLSQLSQVNPVFVAANQPDLSTEISTFLDSRKIHSTLWVPMPSQRALGGALRLDNCVVADESSILGIQKLVISIGNLLDQSKNRLGHHFVDNEESKLLWSIFEALDLGVLVVSTDQKVVLVNPKVSQIFDKPSEYLHEKHLTELTDIFPEGVLPALLRDLGYLKMGMTVEVQEMQRVNASGEKAVLEIGLSSLYQNKVYVGNAIIVEDITFRKNMERKAQESESRLRRVVESIKEGITLSDTQGYFEIFNKEMEYMTGFSRTEANQLNDFIDIIHEPESRDQARSQLADFAEGEKRTSQTTLKAKDGTLKYVSISTTVLNSDNKRYFLSAYHDETAQKQAEKELIERNIELEKLTEQLHQTADELREARDHLEEKVAEKTQQLQAKVLEVEDVAKFPSEDPFPVMRMTPEGTLLYANSASQALIDLWQCRPGDKVPEGWVQLVKEVFETNNRKIYEIEILGQFISFVLVPIKNSNYVNLYGRDVSREKEIDQMKNQFISMVSHQIRTPLTSVRWYSEMLLKGKNDQSLSEKQVEITRTIHDTAVNLTTLVNDLLSISRMESGKLDYNAEPASVIGILEEAINELKPQVEKGKIELTVDKEDIPEFAFDKKLIREVYLNLLSNAIKYTPENGKVKVRLSLKEGLLTSQISDTGIGIPESAKEAIFERFYRAQNAVDREFEGTGLGLAVARMIVEKAGGKIWFESTEGQGTTFFFTLPLQNMI